MAKEIKANVKLQIPAGAATPAPPVGSSLGQHGVNIMDFCKKFNAATLKRKGETVPVVITIYKDKTFDFILKTPPVSLTPLLLMMRRLPRLKKMMWSSCSSPLNIWPRPCLGPRA